MMSNAEVKVLTAVLRDKQVYVLLQANVDRLMHTYSDVWKFIKDYVDQNNTVPPEHLVVEKFRDFAPVKEVGSTKHHLEELQAEYADVRIREILRSAANDVQEGKVNEALSTLITDTADLKRSTAYVRDIDLVDVDSAISHFEAVQKINALGSYGIKVGLPGFDNCLPSGITGGMLGIFLAYPSIGKSYMALYFAVQAWKQGKVPLIISLEMTEQEVRNRVFTLLGEGIWSLKNLSSGQVELDTFKKWHTKVFKDRPPFYIVSNEGVGEVNPAVVKGKIDQYRPDFVVVDYLQLMLPNARADSEVVRMKNLSRELKLLATSENVPILAISSATPDDATDLSKAPTLGQTAWSRQIAYDADFVLAFGRDKNSNVMEVVWRKNRNGILFDWLMDLDFNYGRFRYVDIDDS